MVDDEVGRWDGRKAFDIESFLENYTERSFLARATGETVEKEYDSGTPDNPFIFGAMISANSYAEIYKCG